MIVMDVQRASPTHGRRRRRRRSVIVVVVVVAVCFRRAAALRAPQTTRSHRPTGTVSGCCVKPGQEDAPQSLPRRHVFGAAAAAAAAFFSVIDASLAAAEDDKCKTSVNALFKTRTCVRTGLTKQERLLACLPSENCVSTSAVRSPGQYIAPWSYAVETKDATKAFRSLRKVVDETPDLAVVDVDESRLYLRATAPSTVRGGPPSLTTTRGLDDVEFKLDPEEQLVFCRSASRDSVFFFPAQNLYLVPLSDGDANRARLVDLRKRLGWDTLSALEGGSVDRDEDDPSLFQPLPTPDFDVGS